MKKKLLFLLLNVYSINIYSQIGINTSTVKPGVVLQVDNNSSNLGGVLFPVVNLESTTSIAPFQNKPIDGVMVYNSNTTNVVNSNLNVRPGYYFWDSSISSWSPFESINKNNDVFESSNQDTATDFNTGTNWMDLFANIDTNQNSSLYSKLDAQNLYINQTGFYRVVLNLNFKIGQATQDRDVFGVALFLNGTQETDRIVVKTKENYGGSQTVADEAVLYIYVPSGGASLAVRGFAIHGASAVYFNAPKTSTINIERIR